MARYISELLVIFETLIQLKKICFLICVFACLSMNAKHSGSVKIIFPVLSNDTILKIVKHPNFIDSLKNDSLSLPFVSKFKFNVNLPLVYKKVNPFDAKNNLNFKRVNTKNWWYFIVIVLVIILLLIIERAYPLFVSMIKKSVYNDFTLKEIIEEHSGLNNFLYILTQFIFSIICSLVIIFYLQLSKITLSQNYIIDFWIILSVFIILSYLKFLIIELFSWSINIENFSSVFRVYQNNINYWLTLIFIPLILFGYYSHNILINKYLIFVSIIIFCIAYCIKLLKQIQLSISWFKSPIQIIIFYLCSFELIPILIILKLINYKIPIWQTI